MKLVEVARKMYHVDFSGRASVPATQPEEEVAEELQYGDVFKFGGYFLMTHNVRVLNFKRIHDKFVFDVEVRGTVHVPGEATQQMIEEMRPTAFGHLVLVSDINVRPSRGAEREAFESIKEAYDYDPTFTQQEAQDLLFARKTGDPSAWEKVEEKDLFDKLYRIFLDSGEMPYGTAKARTGDPYEWIYSRLERMSDVEFAGFVRNHTEQATPRLARGKGLGA